MRTETSITATTMFVVSLLMNGTICLSDEPKWGTVKGQVRLVGDIPKIPPLIPGAIPLPDEKLVVDPASRGIANVAIYLMKKPESVHPSRLKSEVEKRTLEIKGRRFDPHLMFVRTEQEIQVLSKDRSAIAVTISPIRNKPFHAVTPPNDQESLLFGPFTFPEKLPVNVESTSHVWMRAYLLLLDHPYAAATDSDGAFMIEDLPVGKHEFTVWQESAGYLDKKYVVEVKDGLNELAPQDFEVGRFLK